MPFLAPVFGAVAAFAGTWVGQLVIGVGMSLVGGLLQKALAPKPAKQRPPGFQLSASVGDNTPWSFIVGRGATAGNKKYFGTWGQSGEVPNAYLTEVFQLASIPGMPGLAGFWANKQRCTIEWNATPTAQGYPVAEFRSGGVNHMWVKFYDGTQTTADPFLVGQFGSHPQYPWTGAAVGRGTPYVIVTTLINRELFQNQPTFLFEPSPMRFYDWRKDSTNGGVGSHRWGVTATYEPTVNPVVIMYNIIRGVYYNGEWVYGGRDIAAFRLPVSSWTPAANECDRPISLLGGGTEPQFRCGYQINVDEEPLDALDALKLSCNGRLAEVGGIFEIMVGAPGAAVYSFTDDDIVVTREQGYRSFPSLNETHNAIEATYPEPSEMWAAKDAPARYNTAWEAEDGGRRLATGLSFEAVPYGVQAQRLMESLIKDGRRWRTHIIALPPSAWILTGTSIVNWISVENGYVNKKFIVMKIDGEPGMVQPVVLLEIDPSDYDWTADMELPSPIGELTIIRPEPQVPTGFQVFPAVFYDADNVARRPTIAIQYDGGMPDIEWVHVLVRLAETGAFVFDQRIPFEVPYYYVLNGVFLPNTDYEVAISYVAYSGRPMEFTEYLAVTTGDIKLVPGKDFDPFGDVVDFDTIGPGLSGWIEQIGMTPRELIEAIQNNSTHAADQELANELMFSEIRTELALSVGEVSASFTQVITVAIVPLQNTVAALADWVTELSAGDGADVSTARFRMTTLSGPDGYSTIGAQTRVDTADPNAWRGAAWFLSTPNNPALPTRFLVNADQFIVVNGSADADADNPFIFEAGKLKVRNAVITNLTSDNIESNSITSDSLDVTTLSAISGNMGTLTAGVITLGGGLLVIDGPNVRILVSD